MQNATFNILKAVAKTREKALRLNISSIIQVKVEKIIHSLKVILASNSGNIKVLSTLKSNIHLDLAGLGEYHLTGTYRN